MPHELKITFNGLCLFLEDPEITSAEPGLHVRCYLLQAAHHRKLLTVRTNDVAGANIGMVPLVSDAEGRELALVEVPAGEELTMTYESLVDGSTGKFKGLIADRQLEWTPRTRDLGLGGELDDEALGQFTNLRLPAEAVLKSGPVITDRSCRPIEWIFGDDEPKLLSNSVVSTSEIPHLHRLKVSWRTDAAKEPDKSGTENWLELVPPASGRLCLGVSNLPDEVSLPDDAVSPDHMGFYKMAYEKKPDVRLPRRRGRSAEEEKGREPEKPGVICPPADGTG